jgi:hypothetical protein
MRDPQQDPGRQVGRRTIHRLADRGSHPGRDAILLHRSVIDALETASEPNEMDRKAVLTEVVADRGLASVETVDDVNDLLQGAMKFKDKRKPA